MSLETQNNSESLEFSSKTEFYEVENDTLDLVQEILNSANYREFIPKISGLNISQKIKILEKLNNWDWKINFPESEKDAYFMRYILSNLFIDSEIADKFVKEKKWEYYDFINCDFFWIWFVEKRVSKKCNNELNIFFRDLTIKEIKNFFENV